MFRRSIISFETDAAQKTAQAVARRRANWVDRRNHKPHHSGRTPYPVHDMPSCELCQVKFRWHESYQSHKESDLHKARVRWMEQEKWWNTTGLPAHMQKTKDDKDLFNKFVKKRAAASGISEGALQESMKRASVNIGPKHSTVVDFPSVKSEIVEPRDQRWPSSPKH